MIPSTRRRRFVLIGILVICIFLQLSNAKRDKKTFKISVFFDDTYENIEDLVSYSTEVTNRFLKSSSFQFEYTINKIDNHNTYKVTRILCNELEDGRIAVIGIGDSPAFAHINSVCASLQIPFLAIKWESTSDDATTTTTTSSPSGSASFMDDPATTMLPPFTHSSAASSLNGNGDSAGNHRPVDNIINIHPPANKLMQAMIDLIEYYKWEYVTILYQESTGLSRIEDLIKLPRRPPQLRSPNRTNMAVHLNLNNKVKLQVRQLSSDVRKWINLIKDVKLSGSSHIIVDIQTRHLNKFLEQTGEIGLMTTYFHFMFTSLDLSILDSAPSANITALQVFEPNDSSVRSLFAEFNLKNMVSHKPMFKYMPSEAIFIYDALMLLANTIDKHNLVDQIHSSPAVSCQRETDWSFGPEFVRYLRMNKFNGLSGNIEFDPHTGSRTNLTLSIVDKTRTGIDMVGYWRDTKKGKPIEIVRSYAKEKDQVMDKLNRNLVITTKLEAPYVMRRSSINNQTLPGNEQYIGFCIDLIERIAKLCNFNYTIKLVEDGLHGTLVDGKWNGIVSELIDKKADLAVAGLTINFQREQVIDFTIPFLNLGISILFKRPVKDAPNLFSFLSPLSVDIWLYMIAAYLIVSFMLFVLARFSPYEWQNPHPCKPESEIVENQFTVLNSLWFTIGSLMQQGIDYNPKSISARILTGAWWFFALIMISSYTANLAAFLTTKRLKSPIEDVEALSKQKEIQYGCLISGSTEQFFRESKIATYERMWNYMEKNKDVFVKSQEEGIERVKHGGYAYLIESTTNDYLRQRDCELMQVGGLLDSKGYGIGTPSGSPWRDQISNAILQLQENGELQVLYKKWWEIEGKDPNQKCDQSDDKKKDSANELSLANVGGVFVVLAVGLILSFFVAFFEFIWKARQASNDQLSLKNKIARDLKFAVCHRKSKKKSLHFRNMDLDNPLKLIATDEDDELADIREQIYAGGDGRGDDDQFVQSDSYKSSHKQRHSSMPPSVRSYEVVATRTNDDRMITITNAALMNEHLDEFDEDDLLVNRRSLARTTHTTAPRLRESSSSSRGGGGGGGGMTMIAHHGDDQPNDSTDDREEQQQPRHHHFYHHHHHHHRPADPSVIYPNQLHLRHHNHHNNNQSMMSPSSSLMASNYHQMQQQQQQQHGGGSRHTQLVSSPSHNVHFCRSSSAALENNGRTTRQVVYDDETDQMSDVA